MHTKVLFISNVVVFQKLKWQEKKIGDKQIAFRMSNVKLPLNGKLVLNYWQGPNVLHLLIDLSQ